MLRCRRLPSRRLRAVLRALIAAVFTAGLASGCAVSQKRTVPPAQIRPAQQATKEQLLGAYNEQARAVRSINAAVEMRPVAGSEYSGLIEEYHDVGGFILAARPAKIRIIGQAPVLAKNIFDMTSDGQVFHIFIPSKNKFLIGPTDLERPAEKPIENLRPQHVLDALFWPEITPGAPVLFEEAEEAQERYYVLTLLRESSGTLGIAHKIWFDRADLRVSRLQVYGPGGRLDSDIAYSDWQPATAGGPGAEAGAASAGASPETADAFFPRGIRIRRPQQDYDLTVSVTRLTLNSEIADDRFMLPQPPGTELVQLENALREAQP
jgi:outer membrane lipoprotein-sorting protein